MKPVLLLPIIAGLAGAASLLANGPVPGDAVLTRALQSLLGGEPAWAEIVTRTAKAPLVWGSACLAMFMAWICGRGRAMLAVPLAYGFAFLIDRILRALIYVPKPDDSLVAVASASSSSGLPSTFGLVYASLFGVVLWCRETGTAARALQVTSVLLLVIGAGARIVLGGHWASQMIASMALGLILAWLALMICREVEHRFQRQS